MCEKPQAIEIILLQASYGPALPLTKLAVNANELWNPGGAALFRRCWLKP